MLFRNYLKKKGLNHVGVEKVFKEMPYLVDHFQTAIAGLMQAQFKEIESLPTSNFHLIEDDNIYDLPCAPLLEILSLQENGSE